MHNNSFSRKTLWVLIFLGSCVLGSAGCGPRSRVPINYVEGIVTVDGVPKKGVAVIFVPTDSDTGYEGAAGTTDANGVFKVTSLNGLPEKGAMAGNFAVTFYLTELKQFDRPVYDDTRAEWVKEKMVNILPAVYQNDETTPIKVTVEKGRNQFQFDLHTK